MLKHPAQISRIEMPPCESTEIPELFQVIDTTMATT